MTSFLVSLTLLLGVSGSGAPATCHARNEMEVLRADWVNPPHVFVVLLARNKEASLPYFLTYFERLKYPKASMTLYLRADHSEDKTIAILGEWLELNNRFYRAVDAKLEKHPRCFDKENQPHYITDEMIEHVIKLKTQAFKAAQDASADYVMFLDVDVYLTNKDTLSSLIAQNYTIVSPMLESLHSYANFWGAFSEDFWYERSDDYEDIQKRKVNGCFQVPVVHSCVLINLNCNENIRKITFNSDELNDPAVPYDDIVSFGVSVQRAGLTNHVCNVVRYGYVDYPIQAGDPLSTAFLHLRDLKLKIVRHQPQLIVSPRLAHLLPRPSVDTAGLSKIFYMNLARRPDRRARMEYVLKNAGLRATRVEAVDGRTLNSSYLEGRGVRVMTGYYDPNKQRQGMTKGEIGCFLTHYDIWKEVVDKQHQRVST